MHPGRMILIYLRLSFSSLLFSLRKDSRYARYGQIAPPDTPTLSAPPRHHETRHGVTIRRRDQAQPDPVRDHRTVPSLLTSTVAVVAVAVAAECACQWER